MNWLLVLLIVAFPLLSHAAAWLDAPPLQWLALVLVVGAALHKGLAARRPRAWAALAAIGAALHKGLAARRPRAWAALAGIAAGLYALARVGDGKLLLYLPPLVILAVLAWVFGSTLLPGRTPLVTHIADAARRLTPELAVYCRHLTQMWTGVFLFLLVVLAVLALSGRTLWWSFAANFLNYGLLGAIFLGEYLYRIHRFPDYDHPGFVEYLRIIIRAGIRPAKPG